MPFEFLCPFCHHKTKVQDKYAGKSGPCVSCGRQVTMPQFDERGMLVRPARQPNDKKLGNEGEPKKNANWMPILISASFIFILVASIITLAFIAFPAIKQKASLAAQRSDADNMLAIAQALNAYSARYGTYPTPYVSDPSGKPLYSWRVLILPFMGYEGLYKRFQLDQAHDSPSNLSLLREMPPEFASKMTAARQGSQTNYVLVVGPGTLFPPSGPLSPQNIDEPTILLVETVEGLTTWTEPKDIEISKGIIMGNRPLQDIGGIHQGCLLIVTTKEEAYSVPTTTSQNLIDAMISPNGGERTDTSPFGEL